MEFGDVNSASGLQALDRHLEDKSYIEGYVPTQVGRSIVCLSVFQSVCLLYFS